MSVNTRQPLVSIVTPSYNCGCYLEETILSIKNQDYPHIEHIIVDGGSQDNTLEILEAYNDQISWISEQDNGMYDAINKGFAMAQGEILTYINSDDMYYSKDIVSLVVSEFVNNPSIDFTFGHCNFVDSDGKHLYTYKAPPFNKRTALAFPRILFHEPTCFWRKSVHINFDSSFKYCGDSNFFRYLCKNYKGKNVNRVIAKFRVREDSFSFTNREKMHDEGKRVFGENPKVTFHMRLYDLIYIRTILNLRPNIKRFILYYQKRPFL